MPAPAIHTVRFEPLGVEMEVEEGETVLNAAFRQGISLMHGCKEGQCGSCKSRLLDGDIELLKYSTFALPDYESETNHVLLCRTHAFSDLTVELLNYDEDLLSRSIAVKEFDARVVSAMTECTGTPINEAVSGSWATARMPIPNFVRFTKKCRPISISNAVTMTRTDLSGITKSEPSGMARSRKSQPSFAFFK